MTVTETNRELLKDFIRLMIDLKVSREVTEAMILMFQTKEQMFALVDWMKTNPQAKEMEIFDQAEKIVGAM